METFVRRTEMGVSAGELYAWHARPGAFVRLSPPFAPVEIEEQFAELERGARSVLRVKVGPTRARWVAELTAVEPGRMFQDTQREGPFKHWVHTHRFEPMGSHRSALEDAIEYQLPAGAMGRLFGAPVARRSLERMFAYRHAITSLDLERHAAFSKRPSLTIALSGASGLIGSALEAFLTTGGHSVKRLVRAGAADPGTHIRWDPMQGEIDLRALEGVDAIIHLAGEPIAGGRWTAEKQERIRLSRTRGTRLLADSCARLTRPPAVLLSGSAIGYYGDRRDELLTEQQASGGGFLADVCKEWEAATAPAGEAGIRVVHLRTGMVLSARGGALAALLTPFKLGVGGPVGNGEQWVSWIGLEDVLGAMQFALFTPGLVGALNLVSPQPIRQIDFAKTLGHVLSRPAVAPLPAAAVRAGLGAMGNELLLASQRVVPSKLLAAGFSFVHPELEGALRFTLGRTEPVTH